LEVHYELSNEPKMNSVRYPSETQYRRLISRSIFMQFFGYFDIFTYLEK